MIRLSSVALVVLVLPAVAWSKPPASDAPQSNSYTMPRLAADGFAADQRVGRTQIAPNAHFGFGMFGLKTEKSQLQPATGREIDNRKQRRAAVGFSLKF